VPVGLIPWPPEMLVDRRRSDQHDAGVMSDDLGVSDYLLQIVLVFLQRNMLLARGIRKTGIVGSKEDGLDRLFSAARM
jgi:hypothetical protein